MNENYLIVKTLYPCVLDDTLVCFCDDDTLLCGKIFFFRGSGRETCLLLPSEKGRKIVRPNLYVWGSPPPPYQYGSSISDRVLVIQ